MNDRRRFERVERTLVTYYRKLWVNSLEYAGVTSNISRGGILVELEGEFQSGDLLALEMVIFNGEPPINLVARVVRNDVSNPLKGLEFVQISGPDEKRLHDYLAARERQEKQSV